MICQKCNSSIDTTTVVKKYQVPFSCTECGGVYIKYQAINGINFIWPKPVEALQGNIYIPERWRNSFKASIGVVLSSGKGCFQKSTKKYVKSWVQPGDIVYYDKTVPWTVDFESTDGTNYTVDMCNILDVLQVVV